MNKNDIRIYTNSSDNSITFELKNGKSETYYMNSLPSKDSYIINALTKEITQGLQIQTIVDNLNNIGELLLISSNALAGTKIRSKITGLQHESTKLCGTSISDVHSLSTDAWDVSRNAIKAYEKLTLGREKSCIEKIKDSEEIANKMADKAEKLAKSFSILSDMAEDAVEETEDEVAVQKSTANELKKASDEYQAQLDGQRALQEQINKDLADVNKEYQEAKKKEQDSLQRKHGFEIASLVSNCIGGIVDMMTPDLGRSNKEKSDPAQEALKKELSETQQKLKSTEQEYEEKQQEQQQLQIKCDTLTAKVDDEQKKIEKMRADQVENENEISSLENLLSSDTLALATCSSELGIAIMVVEEISKKMESLRSTISAISEQCEKLSVSAAKEAEDAAKQKEKIYDNKLKMEEQRRNSLADIAKFTDMIESCSEQKEMAETALRTLQMAASCIKQVVTSLMTASIFWRSISAFCERLHDSDLDDEIQENIDECPSDSRIAYYYDSDFMLMMLKFLCQWGALFYVCKDYEEAMNGIYSKQSDYYKMNVPLDKAYQKAIDLSQSLGIIIQEQIDNQNAVIADLTQKEGE